MYHVVHYTILMKNKVIKTVLIEAYIKKNKLNKAEFCELAKISVGTFNKIFYDEGEVKLVALFNIARVLGVGMNELFG